MITEMLTALACMLLIWGAATFYFYHQKKIKLKKAWVAGATSRQDLIDFINENQDKLYPLATIDSMKLLRDKCREVSAEIKEKMKDPRKKAREFADDEMRKAKKEIGFYFDPFGLGELHVSMYLKSLHQINSMFEVKLQLIYLQMCADKLLNLRFGEVLLDSPCREVFLKKVTDFLEKCLFFCTFASSVNAKKDLAEKHKLAQDIIQRLKFPEIVSFFEPKFKALGLE